jgi:hypothetical protein
MLLFVLALLALPALAQQPLRLTDIQLIGTHNSYHLGLAPSEAARLKQANPQAAEALDYRHPPLEVQLNQGVRQFEFDVYQDPEGGRFAEPKGPSLVAKANLPPDPPFDPAGVMKKPGFKVVHVQDIDYRSNCQPFTDCLSAIHKWSDAHPGHLPIFILVENKDRSPAPGAAPGPGMLTAATMEALDAEIRGVFPAEKLITPDNVRGAHKTLEEAVLTTGWPTLDAARGKVIFLLDQERATPLYTAGHPTLEGRVMFTNSTPGTPDAAFVKMNNATDPKIREVVAKGYLVRTMTDGGARAVREGNSTRRDAAMAGGAQLLSTDYPFDYKASSGYSVSFDKGNVRCNPVRKATACTATALKEK